MNARTEVRTSNMFQPISLLFLRVSLGVLLLAWGGDKVLNARHAKMISDRFYSGLLSFDTDQPYLAFLQGLEALTIIGVLEIVLGVLVVAGFFRKAVYPILLLATGTTLIAVHRSVIDPLGIFSTGVNILFYPSLIIFAGGLVLLAFRAHDRYSIDAAL